MRTTPFTVLLPLLVAAAKAEGLDNSDIVIALCATPRKTRRARKARKDRKARPAKARKASKPTAS